MDRWYVSSPYVGHWAGAPRAMSIRPSAPSQEKSYRAAADTRQLTVSHCPSYHYVQHSYYQQVSEVTDATILTSSFLAKCNIQKHDNFVFHFTSLYNSPSNQDSRDLTGKGLSHLTASHICNTVKCQAHEGGVAAGQVILDGVVDQTDQLAVAVYQYRNEQVALK